MWEWVQSVGTSEVGTLRPHLFLSSIVCNEFGGAFYIYLYNTNRSMPIWFLIFYLQRKISLHTNHHVSSYDINSMGFCSPHFPDTLSINMAKPWIQHFSHICIFILYGFRHDNSPGEVKCAHTGHIVIAWFCVCVWIESQLELRHSANYLQWKSTTINLSDKMTLHWLVFSSNKQSLIC